MRPAVAKKGDWLPHHIKAALADAGWTMAALAQSYGLTTATSLSHAFTRSYPASEQRIADAIGMPVWEIWPSRWNPDGTPKPRGAHVLQCSARARARHGKAVAQDDQVAVGD